MKTPRFTVSHSGRSSGRESALTNSRHNHPASPAAQPLQPPAGHSPLQRFNPLTLQRHSERAVALVITLILLAVTLVMAVAFLAISRRERGSVTTSQDAATAKFAADAALARAEGRIVSQILVTTNPYIFSLVVSTNYINQNGFTNTGNGVVNPDNVNYDHYAPGSGSGPLTAADLAQNIANLYFDPRPPVFYSNDFRFYLDLNRNGQFDSTGPLVTNLDNTSNGMGTVSAEVGDPEWIGILAHPDQPHGPNNPFIARYCFIAVPANSLDLNAIHNQALNAGEATVKAPPSGNDGYSRDEGIGSWEMNLAAFLTDLNTNRWSPPTLWNSLSEPYTYPEGAVGRSVAFDDARALVAWRYDNNYTHPFLASAENLYGTGWGDFAFQNSGIDYYDLGQLYTLDTNFYAYGNPTTMPWLGAPLTNDFFSSPSELFNTNRSDIEFVNNLYSAGTNYSTYDRYTFYRMLGQLGTDTQLPQGKVNVNYQNAIVSYDFKPADIAKYGIAITNVATNITIVANMETNFVSWKPLDFFTVAADRLLRTYTTEWFENSPSNYMRTYFGVIEPYYTNLDGMNVTNIQYLGQTNQIPSFGITNIPVYMNGSFVYSPAVNRLLQLAANIYDASTNVGTAINSNYPSVFRPVFKTVIENDDPDYPLLSFTNVYICGYQYVPQPLNPAANWENEILTMPGPVSDLPVNKQSIRGAAYSTTNVWGVPWIIGAKKGLPNLNGLEVYNTFFIERKLQFNRSSSDVVSPGTPFPYGRTYTTNQMYVMGVSNCFAMDDQNSYADTYSDPVTIVARDSFGFGLSNDAANYQPPNNTVLTSSNMPNLTGWTGVIQSTPGYPPVPTYSFQFPLGTNVFIPQNLSAPEGGPPSTNNLYVYYYTTTPKTLGATPSYTFTGPCFVPTSLDPSNYLDQGTPPLPHLVMQTTNRLQAYMLDTQNPNAPYILDYVQLGGMDNDLDVNAAVADPNSGTFNGETSGLWSTNLYADSDTPNGVVEQYNVSYGSPFPSKEDSDEGKGSGTGTGVGTGNQFGWTTAPIPGLGTRNGPADQIAYFQAFFSGQDQDASGKVTNLDLSIQAPFTPMRTVVQRYVYQINDPLVHYMTQDLFDFPDTTNNDRYSLQLPPPGPQYIYPGNVSDRYMPWGVGGNLGKTTINNIAPDSNPYNYAYRDPMVSAPDYWDFPTNKYPTVGWLGRVHRGTPWQTVYMKSPDILTWTEQSGGQTIYNGVPTWQLWTGDAYNAYDAINTAPDQDRLLFDLFTSAPDDDAMRGQVSVNIGADDPTNMLAGLASWSALLSGDLVLTNNQSDQAVSFNPPNPPNYSTWTIQPLGAPPAGGWPGGDITNEAMYQIVEGINSARTNYGAYPTIDGLRGVYEHVGDILRVPQLSVQSPLLNWNNPAQEQAGINDEMYEWLPQQMMGLMTVSGTPQNPPRYVVYCYGQTLKPAPNGLVSSGTYFGMCTNYQVVAESAARAVIEVQNTPTPANPTATPHVIVRQYNVLPPD